MAELSKRQQEVVAVMQPYLKTAPWIMRITTRKEFTGPVLEICERYRTERDTERLREYGRLYNGSLRTCKRAICLMLSQVLDNAGRPFGIQELLNGAIDYRGQVPLNETVGAKLALLSKLHPQVRKDSRIELMAWRIERFSREETLYWLTKVSVPTYGRRSIEWAKSGLRLMLAGRQNDEEEIQKLLEKLRR